MIAKKYNDIANWNSVLHPALERNILRHSESALSHLLPKLAPSQYPAQQTHSRLLFMSNPTQTTLPQMTLPQSRQSPASLSQQAPISPMVGQSRLQARAALSRTPSPMAGPSRYRERELELTSQRRIDNYFNDDCINHHDFTDNGNDSDSSSTTTEISVSRALSVERNVFDLENNMPEALRLDCPNIIHRPEACVMDNEEVHKQHVKLPSLLSHSIFTNILAYRHLKSVLTS